MQLLANDPNCTRFTRVALDGAADLGFDTAMIRAVVMELHLVDFYKSMTTYADSTIWQDVYRPIVHGVPIYVKLTVYTEVNLLVVSFKRR